MEVLPREAAEGGKTYAEYEKKPKPKYKDLAREWQREAERFQNTRWAIGILMPFFLELKDLVTV